MQPISSSPPALIFDMDGTLVDSIPFHTKSLAVFCQRRGLDLDIPDLMRRTNGLNGGETMRELFQRPMDDEEAWTLIQEKESIYRDLFGREFQEVPGVRQFASAAAALGMPYGVGTAGDKHNIAFVFSHLTLTPAPVAFVGGDEGLPGKPDPAIFLEVARRMGVAPSSCIVFEDGPYGIEAARRAGMRAVGICTSHTPAELAGPHVMATVKNFSELLDMKFLEKLHARTE